MRIALKKLTFGFLLGIILLHAIPSFSQELYTARGYWQESTRDPYRKLKQKQVVGDSLSTEEVAYIAEYETYLESYYKRLSEEEKLRFQQMKTQWDREFKRPASKPESADEFEWRGRDRFNNTIYGLYYGASLVAIADIDGAAAAGIPLITGGLWVLGPVINPHKYDGINRSVIQANNAGKFLGLLYGFSAGLMIGGDSDSGGDWVLGLSTVGSITLGEVAFQLQKKRNFSEGHISLLRHYGALGPWVSLASYGASGSDDAHLAGASLLVGGVAGLLIGNKASKKYDYTRGDVSAVSSFTTIATGIGFTLMIESIEDETGSDALILIPATASVIGTLISQRQVKGAYLNKKQGSTLNLAAGGAALVGLGVAAIIESESPTVWVGLPSAFALITHQLVFSKFKKENLANGLQGRSSTKNFKVALNVMPENYFINQKFSAPQRVSNAGMPLTNPLINLSIKF